MKKIILLIIGLFFLVNLASAGMQDIFLIKLKYENGNISLSSLFTVKGYYSPSKENSGDYSIKIFSCEGKELYSQKFNFSLKLNLAPDPSWFDENGTQIYTPNQNESILLLNSSLKELILPYYNNTKEILIYYKEKETLMINVGFTSECNKISDIKVNSNYQEQESQQETSRDLEKQVNYYLYYFLGFLILVIFSIIIILSKIIKRKK